MGVRAVTVLRRKLFEVSTRTRSSRKKERQSLRVGETCWFGRLPLCIQEAQGLALNAWSRGSVSEACRVPTLKWRWHSKIMKNDDEAEEGMPRAHVHS